MSTFYTILYCPIRPVIDERLSIALLIKGDDKVYFKYSAEKLQIIKNLLPKSAFNLLKSSLRSICKFFGDNNRINSGDLFPDDEVPLLTKDILNESFINYLSSNTNNLLNFSRPKSIDINVNEDVFNELYKKLVFTLDSEEIAESFVFSGDAKGRFARLEAFQQLRRKANERQSEKEKIIAQLLQVKFQIEDYIKSEAFGQDQHFNLFLKEYITCLDEKGKDFFL